MSILESSLEILPGLERKIIAKMSAEPLQKKIQARLNELRALPMKGFSRPGTVPLKVIQDRYGDTVFHEVADEFIRGNLENLFQEKAVMPISRPVVNPKKLVAGQPFEFEIIFEVLPEVKAISLSEVEFEKFDVTIADQDVEKVIAEIRKQHADWEPVTRAAAMGDQVTIDFEGRYENGDLLDRGSAQDFKLELGSGSFIKGFEEGVVGHVAGDEFTLSLTFPADYQAKELANQKINFKVNLKEVCLEKLPEIDEAFFKKLELPEPTLERLRADVRKNLQFEIDDKLRSYRKTVLLSQMINKYPIDVPRVLLAEEIVAARREMAEQYKMKDINRFPDVMFESTAKQRVRAGVLLRAVVQEHQLRVTDEQVEQKLQEITVGYQDKEKVIDWYKSRDDYMSQIRGAILEDMAFDKLQEQVKILVKNISFDDFKQGAIQTAQEATLKALGDDAAPLEHIHDEHCQHDHEHHHEHAHGEHCDHDHDHDHHHEHVHNEHCQHDHEDHKDK